MEEENNPELMTNNPEAVFGFPFQIWLTFFVSIPHSPKEGRMYSRPEAASFKLHVAAVPLVRFIDTYRSPTVHPQATGSSSSIQVCLHHLWLSTRLRIASSAGFRCSTKEALPACRDVRGQNRHHSKQNTNSLVVCLMVKVA
jgi:hypothetical protein